MSTQNGSAPNAEHEGVIENLDEMSAPRRKLIIFGRTISIRRVDEVGLRKWAELERIEQELNQVRQNRTDPDISNETAMQMLEEEIKLRKQLVENYIAEGYKGHEAEFDNMSDLQFQKITDVFTQPPLPLPEQIAALEAAEAKRQERIAAEQEQSAADLMLGTSPDLTDSTESETGLE